MHVIQLTCVIFPVTVDAEMLSQDVTLHGNETTVLKATLQNLTNRLSDINVTNSNVNASMAKNSVHRLRAQNMEALTVCILAR